MAATITTKTLFKSPSVAIRDACCRPHDTNCSAEEFSDVHSIVFPRSGVFVKHIADREVVVTPNQALFFNADEPYRVSHPQALGDDCTVFDLRSDLAVEMSATHQPQAQERPHAPFTSTDTPSVPEVYLLHVKLLDRLRHGVVDDIVAQEISLQLLDAVVRANHTTDQATAAPKSHAGTRAHAECVDGATALLGMRFRERLTLDDIAEAVHSSTYHLCRLFRRTTGMPMHRFLNRLRLRASLEQLMEPQISMTRMALDLGFCDHSHFTNAFRREFDMSPSDFRRLQDPRLLRKMSKKLQV